MAQDKSRIKSSWGGQRDGAGRPKGGEKTKISVSIDSVNWKKALEKSGKSPSHLINELVEAYVEA